MTPKIHNNSKLSKEQEIFANWAVDGAHDAFHDNWLHLQNFSNLRILKIHSKPFFQNFFLHVCKLGHYTIHPIALAKFLESQDFKNTFQKNLTSIFLSLRANSKNPVCVS